MFLKCYNLGYSSVAEHLPNMYEALDLILRNADKQTNNKQKAMNIPLKYMLYYSLWFYLLICCLPPKFSEICKYTLHLRYIKPVSTGKSDNLNELSRVNGTELYWRGYDLFKGATQNSSTMRREYSKFKTILRYIHPIEIQIGLQNKPIFQKNKKLKNKQMKQKLSSAVYF